MGLLGERYWVDGDFSEVSSSQHPSFEGCNDSLHQPERKPSKLKSIDMHVFVFFY